MKIREDYTCPLEIIHDIIRGKWKTLLVFQLRNGAMGFAELRRSITGISEKMLTEQLFQLCEFGLVAKSGKDSYPLQVEYTLTDRGLRLLDAVLIMQEIGIDYMIEHGKEDILQQKGICSPSLLTKK